MRSMSSVGALASILTIVGSLALATGCPAVSGSDGGNTFESPPARRGDAVIAPPAPATDPKAVESFCDAHFTAADAKPFSWPVLAENAAAPTTGAWRWINVWATWCKPCVAEMPMIVGWQGKLRADGVKADLTLFSVDDGAGKVARFQEQHPDLPVGLRIADVKQLESWLGSVGLDASVAIPLNFFVDPEGRTRCVRSGQISDTDYAAIKRVLSGE